MMQITFESMSIKRVPIRVALQSEERVSSNLMKKRIKNLMTAITSSARKRKVWTPKETS